MKDRSLAIMQVIGNQFIHTCKMERWIRSLIIRQVKSTMTAAEYKGILYWVTKQILIGLISKDSMSFIKRIF